MLQKEIVDAYRDPQRARALIAEIESTVTRGWTIMEVCGGQTHTILKHGLDSLVPAGVEFLHGPGCPVCVTPASKIDKAIQAARGSDGILCSLGDMLRVRGGETDLFGARAAGADIRVVYSPTDAVATARENPEREVVYFAIGFETTAPLNALAVLQAEEMGLDNLSLLSAQMLVPPAVDAILGDPSSRVDALLAAGHVCTVMGYEEYEDMAERHRLPIVITGFEPVDILRGVLSAARQLESGSCGLDNRYSRAVRREGNMRARQVMDAVFEAVDCEWRGLGIIPRGGLAVRDRFARFDAERRFSLRDAPRFEPGPCRAGDVLRGRLHPDQCPAFGEGCTPDHPLGAPMVSGEGACAAYYAAGRRRAATR